MDLFFIISSAILLYLQSFPTQNHEMKFETSFTSASIYNIYEGGLYYRCCGHKHASKSDCKICDICGFIKGFEGSPSDGMKIFHSQISDSVVSQKTPQIVLIDYTAKQGYLTLQISVCDVNDDINHQYKVVAYIPSKQTFEYICSPCFESEYNASVYGNIKIVNKIINIPYRFCILVTDIFSFDKTLLKDKSETKLSCDIDQAFNVNEDGLKNKSTNRFNGNDKISMKIITGGNCNKIYQTLTKISIMFNEATKKIDPISFNMDSSALLNKVMFYSYNGAEKNVKIIGYFATVTTFTAVGVADACNYASPISCSDGKTTKCFVKNGNPNECTPETIYCKENQCCNGWTSKKYGEYVGCICGGGYYGKTCDMKDCQESCNNGVCTQFGKCSCHPGWHGHNCLNRKCSKELCNGNECNELGGDFECNCNSILSTGDHCEYMCEPECIGGTCELDYGKATCVCQTDNTSSVCAGAALQSKKSNGPSSASIAVICVAEVIVMTFIIIGIIIAKKMLSNMTCTQNVNSSEFCPKYVENSQFEQNENCFGHETSDAGIYENEAEFNCEVPDDNYEIADSYDESGIPKYADPLYVYEAEDTNVENAMTIETENNDNYE